MLYDSCIEIPLERLPLTNREHLAWRLDHYTSTGFLTACRIARAEGEYGALTPAQVFEMCGMTKRQAKTHARKVVDFKLPV